MCSGLFHLLACFLMVHNTHYWKESIHFIISEMITMSKLISLHFICILWIFMYLLNTLNYCQEIFIGMSKVTWNWKRKLRVEIWGIWEKIANLIRMQQLD